MRFLHKNSQKIISDIVSKKKQKEFRGPWILEHAKVFSGDLMEKFKKYSEINESLVKYFDYDIWMALDPDRIHNDETEYLPDDFKESISKIRSY